MRTTLAPVKCLSRPAAVIGAGLLLSACSADVTRFDFPAFGLGNAEDTTTSSLPAPPEPIYQHNEPKAQKRVSKSVNQQPYQVAQMDSSISRSNLGRPDDNVEPLPSNTAPSTIPSYQPSRPADASAGTTIVRRGDTLYGIARRTGVSVSRIKQANNLAGNTIRIGQRLTIPGAGDRLSRGETQVSTRGKTRKKSWTYDEPETTASVGDRLTSQRVATKPSYSDTTRDGSYRVQAGDSLYAIARRTGVSSKRIAEANDIYDPSRLRIGQVLTIPGQSSGFSSDDVASTPATSKPRRVASLKKSDDYDSDASATVQPSNTTISGTNFRWPVRGRIISRFGGKTKSGNNDGINLAVPEGTSVKAVEDGVVAYSGGELKGYGQLVLVRHDKDWVSAYAHNSKLLVKRGDRIRRGQIIAKAGRTGAVDRPQVHFELRKGSKPVDPLRHLASN
ncbi:MAG: LysM peptidoglycan-binding domain-containing protein [Hyphomicrobiaceae bacterium]